MWLCIVFHKRFVVARLVYCELLLLLLFCCCCWCCFWHRSLFLSLLNAHDASVRPLRRSEKTFTFFLLHQHWYKHTYICTYSQTYVQTYIHTYIRAHVQLVCYIVVVLTITVVSTHIATSYFACLSYLFPFSLVLLGKQQQQNGVTSAEHVWVCVCRSHTNYWNALKCMNTHTWIY